uniref:Uncharacterized protein n=1 Tax=Physcomitrium patens TaxID=3218 RepID=A0A2K1J1N0_PHYPA|nr:hypothetical protein PHYPA_023331 [Physcomitrium patens]
MSGIVVGCACNPQLWRRKRSSVAATALFPTLECPRFRMTISCMMSSNLSGTLRILSISGDSLNVQLPACATQSKVSNVRRRTHHELPQVLRIFRRNSCGARLVKIVSQATQESGDGSEAEDFSWDKLPFPSDDTLHRMGINVNIGSDPSSDFGDYEQVHDKTSGYQSGLEIEEGYVSIFVRMLSLNNPVEDREAGVLALWRHSAAGADKVKEIVMFPGCLNLVVALLPSEREATAEAAAGLLRNISAIEEYRSLVAEAGTLEEIAGLLTRHKRSPEVRKQALSVLWNVSLNERERNKLADLELLPALLAIVDSEEEKETEGEDTVSLQTGDFHQESEKEAAIGVLATLSYSPCNHEMLIRAGVIPRLARILLEETSSSKVTRQEARKCLLQLAKDPIQKSAIIETGLVPVPLIGASAFRTFKPVMEDTFAIPEDIQFTENPSLTTVFGADKLLRGLKIGPADIDKITMLLNEGKVRQQFLARIGVIEKKNDGQAEDLSPDSNENKYTFMPWWDGIARLVLILGLQNPDVAKEAAESVAEIAITEAYRQAFHKAGAVPHLVKWLGSGDVAATEAAALALDKLGKSQKVRRAIEAHGAVPDLIEILRASDAPPSTKERVVSTLLRFSQEGGGSDAMIQDGAIPGLMDIVSSEGFSAEAKEEAEGILQELSFRKPDSRDKIVAAGGLPPLIAMLATGSPLQAEKAASVLENLAKERENAEAVVKVGVEAALLSRLNVKVQEGDVSNADSWMVIIAASKLLEGLVKHDTVVDKIDIDQVAAVLLNILQASTSPSYVKNWVSPCLRRLQSRVTDKGSLPIGLEITIHGRIPELLEEIGETSELDVQEKAVLEMQDLVSEGVGAYSAAIASGGGIFPLVSLLENGTDMARSAALAVLYNLGMDEENHAAMLAAEAVPALQRLIKREVPDWKLALYLLRTLPT